MGRPEDFLFFTEPLQKDGLVIPEAAIGNQAFEKSMSSGFPLSRE
jgi:hypothetical protein